MPQPASLLKLARVARGLTLYDLADRVGVSAAHLSRAERGEAGVSPEVACRILSALDYPSDALFSDPHAGAVR